MPHRHPNMVCNVRPKQVGQRWSTANRKRGHTDVDTVFSSAGPSPSVAAAAVLPPLLFEVRRRFRVTFSSNRAHGTRSPTIGRECSVNFSL
jgi:hypothetical protein